MGKLAKSISGAVDKLIVKKEPAKPQPSNDVYQGYQKSRGIGECFGFVSSPVQGHTSDCCGSVQNLLEEV